MNISFVLLGLSTLSLVMMSLIAYKLTARVELPRPEPEYCRPDLSYLPSLEDDFRDILSCVPVDQINQIFYDYLMYDREIANARSFLDDHAKFVVQEIRKIPHTSIVIGYLRDMGINVEHWHFEIMKFWKNLPQFVRPEPGIAAGGLTVMIHKMMQSLPKDELHAMLRAKAGCSEVFKVFVTLLRSKIFTDMCRQIGNNSVLARHLHWAMESDIEVIFALEFIRGLHLYLTEGLV